MPVMKDHTHRTKFEPPGPNEIDFSVDAAMIRFLLGEQAAAAQFAVEIERHGAFTVRRMYPKHVDLIDRVIQSALDRPDSAHQSLRSGGSDGAD